MRLNSLSRDWTFKWTKDLKPKLGLDPNYKGMGRSKEKVEVVIPCLIKDLVTLPIVVESLRKFLNHPLGNIYIVAPSGSTGLVRFCKNYDCIFVDEASVAPLPITRIDYKPKGIDRAGWIYQQLIKLSSDSLATTRYFLVWDADMVLTKPQAYYRHGKFVINHSDEYHDPYFEIYRKLLNEVPRSKVSFVSHQMLISKDILRQLRTRLESESGKDWWRAILDSLDPNQTSSFSEYELYGNFINRHHPRSFILEYWFNNNTPGRDSLISLVDTEKKYAKTFKSVSWHSYN